MRESNSMTPIAAIKDPRFVASPISPDLLLDSVALSPARAVAARFASASLPEESIVIDDRSHLTPAQMVEAKLMNRLRECSLSVSHLQVRGMVRNRFEA
jgi:hypothetical protein